MHHFDQADTVRAAQEDLLLGRHLRGVRRWGQNGTAIAPQPTCENIAATVTQDNVKQHQCVPEDAAPADPAWAKCEIEGCCYTFAAALNRPRRAHLHMHTRKRGGPRARRRLPAVACF